MNTTISGDAMIHKTPFAGMYNVSRADGVEFGHVTNRLADGWTAYTWVEDGDIQVGGVFATMEDAVTALSNGGWPTADPDADQGAMSGDLGEIVAEARGWMGDCGVDDAYDASDSEALNYTAWRFEGGLHAFVLAVWPLVTPSRIAA